jgi:GntR family transcriptional regulator, transcriptional repressor for pyruvate dehydrogenase complex
VTDPVFGAAKDQIRSATTSTTVVDRPVVDGLFAPLRLKNAGQQVAERLVTALALGVFVPGQRLPTERDLAATLGTSRTTVREAMSRLAASGYVDVRRGRHGGAYVMVGLGPDTDEMISRTLGQDWPQFEQLFDFRALIEPLIAATAASRRTPEDIAQIEAALEAYRSAGASRERSGAADQALHHAIATAAHNPYLVDLSERLRQGATLGFRAEAYSVAIRERAIVQHGELARAVIAGDPDAAAPIAGRHFTTTETRLRELYEQARAHVGAVRDTP